MQEQQNSQTKDYKVHFIVLIIVFIISLMVVGGIFLWGEKNDVNQEEIVIKTPDKKQIPEKKQNEKKNYPPKNFVFENNYPENVQIITEYIPDLPKETEYGPCNVFGQEFWYQEKETILNSEIGDSCQVNSECGRTPDMDTFCQIQKHGDSKGRLEIYESPNDAEWIKVQYRFYSDDYKVTIWAYNSLCEINKPCGNLKRWESGTKVTPAKEFIDAYVNDERLVITLDNKQMNFNEIFNKFKETLETIELIESVGIQKTEEKIISAQINEDILSEHDKVIEDNSFWGLTNPVIINCAKEIDDEVKSNDLNRMSFFGQVRVNGKTYDKRINCLRFKKDCEEEVLNTEEKQIQDTIDANRFNIINGCLYDGERKALNYNLFAYTQTDFFTKKTDRIGEYADEWFRFEHNNKLYIYLNGAAGCGGCIFNGPYLIIDLNSGLVEGKVADLPYLPYLVLSPNKKIAIESDWDDSYITKLYLFDFLNNKRGKLLFEVPEDKTILIGGHGVFLSEGAIIWSNSSEIKIQLYEKSETGGLAKSEYIKDIGPQYFKSGEPIIIKIEN